MSKNPTVPEIKQQLDSLGVEYESNMKKEELIMLLEVAQKKPPESKKYVVLYDFKDLEDNSYVYFKDDPFPRKGKTVDDERIQELSTTNNKRNKILIKEQD